MKAGKLKSKKYTSAADVPSEGEIVTIDDVKIETLRSLTDGTSKDKGVIYFKETGVKPLALNSTNIDRITELLGTDETDDWIGQRIKLVVRARLTRSAK